MSFGERKLYELLPAIHRIRDLEQGSPLQALLAVVAREISVLEEDLEQLYDDQFIETCAEWAVPYIGDAIGYRSLYNVVPNGFSARAEVANTIGYRRRKGTAAMLEQLARDVTGWNCRVVEFFQLLATTQHMNHLRSEHFYAPNLRRWEPLHRLNSAFESTPHTVDVRSISGGEGKYNIPNIGIFLFRLNAYSLTESPARKLNDVEEDQRYLFSPLGNDLQLFSRPETEEDVIHLAEPTNVPEPIRRRILHSRLSAYYGKERSFTIFNGGQEVPPEKIVVCNLSDIDAGQWAHGAPEEDPATQTGARIAVDPELGRIVFPRNSPSLVAQDPHVTFHYGFSADVGGGEYPRDASFKREFNQSGRLIRVPQDHSTIQSALSALGSEDGIVEITDNASYAEALTIQLAASQTIELRAADGRRPHLVLQDDLTILGDADSEALINGFLISTHGINVPAENNQLAMLRLSHVTLVPGRSLLLDGKPAQPDAPSMVVALPNTLVEVERCITGSVRVSSGTRVSISDSIVDGTSELTLAYADETGARPGGPLEIVSSTVIGRVHTASLRLASNVIFFGQTANGEARPEPVYSETRQSGCVRFSYVPADSRTPRRFHCQPDLEIQRSIAVARKQAPAITPDARNSIASGVRAGMQPGFTSLGYGQPGYVQLRTVVPVQIRRGADDESEMGAFHCLFAPQRETNLRVRFEEYLRFGLEAGTFYAT